MKRFKDFVNESNEEQSDDKFLKFLDEVKKAFTKDFKRDTTKEAESFINQYYGNLKDAFDNGFTVREAIASTKIPGTMVVSGEVDESYLFDIDDEFEKSYEEIDNIDSKDNLDNGVNVIDNYYRKYYKKSFSDKRIFERLKNNYNTLISLYEQKVKDLE